MSKSIKKEETYYYDKIRMRLLTHRFHCFISGRQVGCEDIGNIDLVGVKDIGGWSCGEIEVIGIEVKKANEDKKAIAHFGKQLGQALGYSLLCHRVYLAGLFLPNEQGFSEEQKYLANHLGVGLIEAILSKNGSDVRGFHVVQTSRKHTPIEHKLNSLLYKLRIRKCTVCGVYFEDKKSRNSQIDKYIIPEQNVNRNLLFTKNKHKERWVCKTCQDRFDFNQKKLNKKEKQLLHKVYQRRRLEFNRFKKLNAKLRKKVEGVNQKIGETRNELKKNSKKITGYDWLKKKYVEKGARVIIRKEYSKNYKNLLKRIKKLQKKTK